MTTIQELGGYSSSFTNEISDVETYKKELILRTLYGEYGGKIPNSVVGAGVIWSKLYKTEFIRNCNVKFVPGLVRAQDTVFFLNLLAELKELLTSRWLYTIIESIMAPYVAEINT